MRIEYLRLKNFANIYAAMGKKDIQLHFPDNGKKVHLIVGENGSGKTSIIDQLHPFVENGSTRTVRDLLIPDETSDNGKTLEAYKEIHIKKGDTLYVIKHFVNNTGNVKSFIDKDGVDLNPNGNVQPFKEIVEDELYVTLDFLKLLNLGTKSQTFTRMTSTERKKFISELMTEVEFYNQAYKNATEETRVLRRMLNDVVSDQEKNRVDGGEDQLNKLKKSLEEGLLERDNLLMKLSRAKTILEQHAPKGLPLLREKTHSLIKRKTQLEKELKTKTRPSKDIQLELQTQESQLEKLDSELTSMKEKRDQYINRADNLWGTLSSHKNELSRISTGVTIDSLNQAIIELEQKKLDGKGTFGIFENKAVTFTKDMLMESLQLLKDIEKRTATIYSFNSKQMDRVLSYWLGNERHLVLPDIMEEMEDIDADINKQYQKKQARRIGVARKDEPQRIIIKRNSCDCDCPFEDFYKECTGIGVPKETTTIDKKIDLLEKKKDTLEEGVNIHNHLVLIEMILESNKLMIQKLPFDYLNEKEILKNIQESKPLYDEANITFFINKLEEYNQYLEIDERLESLKKELETLTHTQKTIDYLSKQTETVEKEIRELKEETEKIRLSIQESELIKEDLLKKIDKLKKEKELSIYTDMIIEEYSRIEADVHKFEKSLHIADSEYINIQSLEKERSKRTMMNERMEFNINQLSRKIENYKQLEETKKYLSENFEIAQYVRDSLSSKEGIPLIYMNIYMTQTLSDINDILDIVYKGSMQIPRFDINEKDFNIPYINNGIEIRDVSQCSQGEETFMSIAISFAFISRTLDRQDSFNIPRFDEIDGALDISKREQFLDIVELQIDKIQAEQIFIISHNQAFDSYPVNVIELTPGMVDSYTNKTNIDIIGR